MEEKSLSGWVKSRLTDLLGFPVPQEMIRMILTIDNKEDLDNHLCTLLDVGNVKHYKFMQELVSRKEKASKNVKPTADRIANDYKPYANSHQKQPQKQQQQHNQQPQQPNQKQQQHYNQQQNQKQQQHNQQQNQKQQQHNQQQHPQQQQSKKLAPQNQPVTQQGDKGKKCGKKSVEPEKTPQNSKSAKGAESSSTKKKKKVVNLSDGGSDAHLLLEGRHKCNCEASKHKLINNCLHCGRIVCEQEGSGPCLVCSNLVCSKQEKNILNTNSKQSDLLLQKLYEKEVPESGGNTALDQAVEQRNKLLEYDRTSEKRTTVIDDESDYYSVNSVWLSQEERDRLRQKEEEARAKKHKSKRHQRYAIDFAGRQIVEADSDEEIYDIYNDDVMAALNKKMSGPLHISDSDEKTFPSLPMQPEFQEKAVQKLYSSKGFKNANNFDDIARVQDKEFLEMSDLGHCLSMHQPWASLLVAGIKVHEGRTWYTHHRGRLWIAAGSKTPAENEIKKVENVYRFLRGEEDGFPSSYPTGCLLGCVNVVDCITQEEYQLKYPDGECDSPFVIICRDPVALPYKFLITGQHKIYRLDPKIHHAALKALEKVAIF